MSKAKVVAAYVFDNGLVMAFDDSGKQVEAYQGRKADVLRRIQADYPKAQIYYGSWRPSWRRAPRDES